MYDVLGVLALMLWAHYKINEESSTNTDILALFYLQSWRLAKRSSLNAYIYKLC